MEIAAQIKKHRAELGLSQEALAERIYVTRQSVSNWETGKTYPDLQSLLRMSDLFHVSLDQLIRGDEEGREAEPAPAEVDTPVRYAGLYAVSL